MPCKGQEPTFHMPEAWCLWIWVSLAPPALDPATPVEGAAVSWPSGVRGGGSTLQPRPAVLCKVGFLMLRGKIRKFTYNFLPLVSTSLADLKYRFQ